MNLDLDPLESFRGLAIIKILSSGLCLSEFLVWIRRQEYSLRIFSRSKAQNNRKDAIEVLAIKLVTTFRDCL